MAIKLEFFANKRVTFAIINAKIWEYIIAIRGLIEALSVSFFELNQGKVFAKLIYLV